MPNQDLTYLTIAEAAAGQAAGQYSAVELTHALLNRIAELDNTLHAYITVTGDIALDQARQADEERARGQVRGPLHGIPVALKDLFATRGIRTTAHSAVLQDWVPDADAAVTSRLREAGTVLLGKLSMHEFAYGGPTLDGPFPPARNPWNVDYVPGGSSSGSGVALAAGLCLGALGSDTGGSIRGPASLCGIVGLKPTYGRVSRAGVLPLSWSLDHAGPMARTVEDCALLLQAIAGYDAADPASVDVPVDDYSASLKQGVDGLRLGVPRSWFAEGDGTHGETLAAVEEALRTLESLGATLVEIDGQPFADARAANHTILTAEGYAYHEHDLQTQPHNFGRSVRSRLLTGALISAADYIQAQRARATISARIATLMHSVDAVVSPVSPTPADAFDAYDPDRTFRLPNFNNAYNLTGLPAISVPCGFSSQGLPIGLQVATPPFAESLALLIAYAYEQATDWHLRRPPLEALAGR